MLQIQNQCDDNIDDVEATVNLIKSKRSHAEKQF